ncbi:MAG: ATP-binding protein, partial [Firmicutes bacterium]|nr:ATP-binding protein [Bacillota bacterium]
FGDIDIEDNRAWCEERCRNAGIKPVFPLWHNDRTDNVYELIHLGYRCVIKSINNTLLPKDLLGKIIDVETVAIMKDFGIDICGGNGEYHTLAVDGPVFHKPLPYRTGEILDFGAFSVIDIITEEI